jgi:THO complex subunit 1
MENFGYDFFIGNDLEIVKSVLQDGEEDLVIFELMKLSPKIINNFYSFSNPEPVHKLCKICEWLQLSRTYDECKILNVLEDVLTCIDSQSLPEYLNYLETATKNIKKKENENKCRSIVLRICNSLFKRLGKKEHKPTRTALHAIIVNCMGTVTERSGVNFRGQFSVKKFKNVAICDSLFSRVYQALLCARDPFVFIRDTSKMDRIIENIEKLIDDLVDCNTSDNQCLCFTPIEEIFDLQVKDKDFFVYFLSSLALMSQTLLKPSTKSQETALVLSETQKAKLNSIISRSKQLIEKVNPTYLKNFEKLIENESNWVNWKWNKCFSFEKPAIDEFAKEIQVELEDGEVESEEAIIEKPQPLFEPAETEPNLQNFVTRVLVDLDPDEGIEDEYKSVNDPVFSWRFLRMVSFSKIEELSNDSKPNIEAIAGKLKQNFNGQNLENHLNQEEAPELPQKRSNSISSSGSKHSKLSKHSEN